MEKSGKNDGVDRLIGQWETERPDLNLDAMALFARLKRCTQIVGPLLDRVYREFDLSAGDFDVLATLRRSGAPYCLSPTALFDSLLLTSGTMTHRLKRLEARGLIERLSNPEDARSLLVQLSAEGLRIIDMAVSAHVENEDTILQGLDPRSRTQLAEGLKAMLGMLEALPQENAG